MEKTYEQERKEFEDAVRPAIKWMAENQHPFTRLIIQGNLAELFSSEMSLVTDEYTVD